MSHTPDLTPATRRLSQTRQPWSPHSRRTPAPTSHNDHNHPKHLVAHHHPARDNLGCLLLSPHNHLSGITPVDAVDKDT